MNEIVLTESRAARSEAIERTDVLDKVKALATLSDDTHVTTELIAGYFEVSTGAIDSLVRRNRDELVENGLRVVRGEELRDLKTDLQDEDLFGTARAVTLFTRRTVLNVGMLLVDSDVARAVRSELLDRYEEARTTGAPDLAELARIAKLRLEALSVAHRDQLIGADQSEWIARGILRQMDPTLDPWKPGSRRAEAAPKPTAEPKPDPLPGEILAAVRANPGVTANGVVRLVEHGKPRVLAALRKLVDDGDITITLGPNNSHLHHVVDGPIGVIEGGVS